MKEIVGIILAIAIVTGMCYGAWTIKRKINYKFGYADQVEKQIKPLMVRIDDLEKRVKQLESK
jgi:hypothetical protein